MAAEQFKGQLPLTGIVMCCTSISVEARDDLHLKATQMGASCIFDLTVQVTHLVIGEVGTPKYKYVAKERPDVKVVLPGFVEAIRSLWMAGDEVDVAEYEEKFQAPPFFGLSISLTGFADVETRNSLIQTIISSGAEYRGDLNQGVSHLVAKEPTGRKYDRAQKWGMKIVGAEWLSDSIARGMALDESLYDVHIEPANRGRDAWIRPENQESTISVKRQRDDREETVEVPGRRKMRRTVSTKLSGEQDAMLAYIAAGKSDKTVKDEWREEDVIAPGKVRAQADGVAEASHRENARSRQLAQPTIGMDNRQAGAVRRAGVKTGVFSDVLVYIHGFDRTRTVVVEGYLTSHGAVVCKTADELNLTSDCSPDHSFLMVPHDLPISRWPSIADAAKDFIQVTEWWVEKCLEQKKLVAPEQHPLCRPFFTTPLPDFKSLIICSTSFIGVEILHISKMVTLLGATYDQFLKPGVSVLICGSPHPNEEKLGFAKERGIPAVSSNWLWACLENGKSVPSEEFLMEKPASVSASITTVKTVSMQLVQSGESGSDRASKPTYKSNQKITTEPSSRNQKKSTSRRVEGSTSAKGGIAAMEKPVTRPLQELEPHRLNTSPKRTQTASASPEKTSASEPISKAAESSAQPLTTLATILASRLAAGASSNPEEMKNNRTRRKRGLLGRAASFEGPRRGPSVAVSEPTLQVDRAADVTVGSDGKQVTEILLSQRIIYEDETMREERDRIIAELGGMVQERSKGEEARTVGLVRDENPNGKKKTTGISTRARARRND